MSKEKQIEEMAKTLCGEKEKRCENCDSYRSCEFWIEASILHNTGYRKQSESVWYFYSKEVECHGPNGVTKKQVTGWICGNCKKYSTGIRNFCPECGAKMKGVLSDGNL